MTVCVSLFGDDTTTLIDRLRSLATRRRLVELRLDRLGPEVDLVALHEARGQMRVLLACVPVDQGGTFEGDDDAWQRALERALRAFPHNTLIDVPWGRDRPSTFAEDVPVVWSWHEARGDVTTDLRDIDAQLVARARPGDVRKIVAWAETARDAWRAQELQADGDPRRVAFAQGPGGRASRLAALAQGSPWTYASWRGEATAPGQWAEHELPSDEEVPTLQLMGVLGDPIEHSKSPELWQAAFRLQELADVGLSAAASPRYLRFQVPSLTGFRAAHAHRCFRAFSVTAPLKEQVLEEADEISPRAQMVGASNFLMRTAEGHWRAEQTDGAGALDPLEEAGWPVGGNLLVIGAGGAARAVIVEALERGCSVRVGVRRPEAGEAMRADLVQRGCSAAAKVEIADLTSPQLLDLPRPLGIVQATPCGSHAQPGDPLPGQALDAGCFVLDMVYHPIETPLLTRARAEGATAVRGHCMLLAQMQRQFELTGRSRPPRGPLQLVLEASLGLPCPPILLCGPRASGKSTLGRMLAEVLDWPFVDADEELESRHGRSIAEWLPADAASFRAAEAELLEELADRPARVVALGGGVIETPQALERLAAHPRVLGLALEPAEQLARRLAGDDARPALTEHSLEEEIRLLHDRRQPLYEKACSGRWICVGGMKADSFPRLLQRLKLLL